MTIKSLYRKVSVVLAVVMRSWPPHHRLNTDNEKRQTENGTQTMDAGDKLLSSYPSVSPQLSYRFHFLQLQEIDKDIKGAYVEPLKEKGGYTDLDLLIRTQNVRQLNRIARLLEQLKDSYNSADCGRSGNDKSKPVETVG